MDYINQIISDDFSTIAVRLLVALVLSGIIGFERELNNHSAGFRTHILVGVGSCLMIVLSLFGFHGFMDQYENIRFDPARLPSYVISGIGFLGAGTIIVYGGTIRGLTTAASIWTVAGIGLIVGAGMFDAAILATLIILISLVLLNNIERLFPRTRAVNTLIINTVHGVEFTEIVKKIESFEVPIKNMEIIKTKNNKYRIRIQLIVSNKEVTRELYKEIIKIEGVEEIIENN